MINAEQCEHIDQMKDNPFPVNKKWVGTTQWSWYHMRRVKFETRR